MVTWGNATERPVDDRDPFPGRLLVMSSHAAAELTVTADHVDRYRQRIAALAAPLLGSDHDDVVAAIYEAERSLRTAQRSLERAARLLGH